MERKKIEMRREGNRLIIGDSPQLIVDLDSQENHLLVGRWRSAKTCWKENAGMCWLLR